jgi:hypothetical protein
MPLLAPHALLQPINRIFVFVIIFAFHDRTLNSVSDVILRGFFVLDSFLTGRETLKHQTSTEQCHNSK